MSTGVDGFKLEHLVCEADSSGLPAGYLWYELDWDADRAGVLQISQPESARIVTTTRGGPRVVQSGMLHAADSGPSTHVQFETTGTQLDRRTVVMIQETGTAAIVALHLNRPPASIGHLSAVVEDLAVLKADFIKVVFPCSEATHVRWGTDLLRNWDHTRAALSITPAGGPQARLAAALAGSRLVYAPQTATRERMAAEWYRQLVCPDARAAHDPGVHT